MRAEAAEDDGRDGAEPLGGEARFELAEFVGGADEDHVDGVDAAAHFVGSGDLDQGAADDHADHVGGADHHECEQRED